MSIEYVLMIALVMYVFYHFVCRCNRVEGLSECGQALQSMCGYTAGSGSCKDCNACVSRAKSNYKSSKELRDVGCSVKTLKEFCSLPEQQQENTLYLINDGELKDDGKAKLMEILGKYRSGLIKNTTKKFELLFGISNGSDYMEINIDDLEIDNLSWHLYDGVDFGSSYIGRSPQSQLDFLNVSLSYYLIGGYHKFHMFIQKYTSDGLEPPIIINFTDDPNKPDDYTKEYDIKFSYYLC